MVFSSDQPALSPFSKCCTKAYKILFCCNTIGTSPHTHNDAELHINGLKTPFTSVKTLRVTHLPLSLKAPCAAHVLSSTLKDRAAHPHDLCIVTASLSKGRWGTSSWVALCATIMKSKSCCCPFPSKSTLSLAKQSTDGPLQRASPPQHFRAGWLADIQCSSRGWVVHLLPLQQDPASSLLSLVGSQQNHPAPESFY